MGDLRVEWGAVASLRREGLFRSTAPEGCPCYAGTPGRWDRLEPTRLPGLLDYLRGLRPLW